MTAAFTVTALFAAGARTSDKPLSPPQGKTLFFKIAKELGPDNKVRYFDDSVHAVTYFRNGAYDQKGMDEIDGLLRDRARDEPAPRGMDKALLDLLYDIGARLEARHPGQEVVFHVISGYRDPETNKALRNDPRNPFRSMVARRSNHSFGKAIDFYVPGISGKELRDTAWCEQKGGVGWYPQFKDMFPYRYVHVDTGRVRRWGFNPPKTCP